MSPSRSARSNGWVPAALLVLSLVPAIPGAVLVTRLARGAAITADNARFFAAPTPVVLHILAAIPFGILGALQFAHGFRRRSPEWHRIAGRVWVVCGLVVALSGLWMSVFYPLPEGDGELLRWERLLFGSAMVASLVLGFVAIRRRDIAQHRLWMARGYAIGMGAGTQVFTHIPWYLLFGKPGQFPRAMLMGAGWVINLAVVEWAYRSKARRRVAGVREPV